MANKNKPLTNEEIAAFCAELALIIRSGISMQEGLLIIAQDSKGSAGEALAAQLADCVEMGEPLAKALEKSDRFPKYMVKMVGIGETSGRLDEVLQSLCEYYEHSEALSRSIKGAVTYPLIMIAMMLVVILVIVVEVLPVFEDVFHQLGGEMSGFAQGILAFGRGISRYAAWIVGALVLIAAAILILSRLACGRAFFRRIYEGVFKKTTEAVACARFASAMALMLSSAMDVHSALEMTLELTGNRRMRARIEDVKKRMLSGEGFAAALSEAGLFPGLYGRMIALGSRTGNLDGVMRRIARQYEQRSDRMLGSLVSKVEPTLVAVLALIVGMILLSVMLPLMGVMSAIG